MKKIGVLLSVVLVGIGVALTYHIFENLVHESINLVWYDWFNTNNMRLLVIPLTVIISLLFFGLQHFLDRKSENKTEEGLGEMPNPVVKNYLKVLLIGYFSLLAGATLGPEAILVPASMILGAIVGSKLFGDKQIVKLLTAAGIMALFTAFFFSIVVGILSVFLVIKQAKTKLSPILLLTAVIASTASFFTLKLVEGSSYLDIPHYTWHLNVATVLSSLALVIAGYIVITGMGIIHERSLKLKQHIGPKPWWQTALLASVVIAALYLLGGHLVEFTGNLSIIPMFQQAASLGLWGLIWILVVKVALISWSKAAGYRGGMIFPTIFLAAVLVAIIRLYQPDLNYIYGLIAVLVGAFAANRKNRILV